MGDQAVSMKVRPRQEIKSVDNKIAPMSRYCTSAVITLLLRLLLFTY